MTCLSSSNQSPWRVPTVLHLISSFKSTGHAFSSIGLWTMHFINSLILSTDHSDSFWKNAKSEAHTFFRQFQLGSTFLKRCANRARLGKTVASAFLWTLKQAVRLADEVRKSSCALDLKVSDKTLATSKMPCADVTRCPSGMKLPQCWASGENSDHIIQPTCGKTPSYSFRQGTGQSPIKVKDHLGEESHNRPSLQICESS